ncbi:MAG: N-acetylglucosamine-6-phosphate deacetylase [Clostridia bacterium]|nr:N-acetylglucosamine-6-phosphate deacetylase [Clostridia bacterium]
MNGNLLINNASIYDTSHRSFFGGNLLIRDGLIEHISADEIICENASVVDAHGAALIPGLVDVHSHGRIGYDFDSATADQMKKMRMSYAAQGTTTVVPTIASAPFSQIESAIENVKAAGFDAIHLEARYLHPKRRGAHREDLLSLPDQGELLTLLKHCDPLHVHISCAPELSGGEEFIKTARMYGATVGLAHSDADYDTAMHAIEWGITSFTHTFNAMPAIHHRNPGPVTAALTSEDAYCEIIADGFHLHPAIVKLAYLAKQPHRLVLITDSMSATCCPDGEYSIAGEKVFVRDGKAVNTEGAIAGSTITLLDAVRNLMRFCGISLAQALPYATIIPARMIELDSRIGSIECGKRADLLLLKPDSTEIDRVFCSCLP